jgi:hypothetical protein
VKTSVEIPDSLFLAAKEYARSHDMTFGALIEEGLRVVLNRNRHAAVKFRLRDGSFGGQRRNGKLSWTEIRSVTYEGRGE